MPRLTAPNGATVSVSDEKAALLLAQGFRAVGEQEEAKPKRRTRKATPSTDDE